MTAKAPNMPLTEICLPGNPAVPGTDADQPSATGENLLKMPCDETSDAHYCSSTNQSKEKNTHQITSPSPDDTDEQSHAAHDHIKVSVTSSDPGLNTFPFMRLPAEIRLCVYDQLVAMPVTRSPYGPRVQIYYTKPSVGILRWIEGVFVNDWEGPSTHLDNKAVTFEFMKRAILSLRQGTFSMHIILNDSNLLLDDTVDDWFCLIKTLAGVSAACPSPIDGMLRISVPADCIAHMRTVLSTPYTYGRSLRPKMWKVDMLEDDT
ncbi:uncharacterized protein J4E78_000513 [Alternaria triticimaculans]|uniref:uncharacterized protein n=1 Tax=Alternaria triticimaculans TaxID=297637 RepID=UPI0020C2DC01|nr:uncharacterized protein J4E78_000513 [Alternaria triticimaculans]KAI4672014.1 hypothetical protein J4E78_000513 [Alternaria triticimaculans]